jgi:ABC-type branched-subunit amino acid transport system ATPase component
MSAASGLCVRDLTVRFGGLVAVAGVGLEAPHGRITGLIGPNGAGKTTTFNACSGLVRASQGSIVLDGVDVTRRSPAARARLGLGRTFQRVELFGSLTVRENVRLGREAAIAGDRPLAGHLWMTRREHARVDGAAEDAIELCGLGELADHPVRVLSTGQARLVELARALSGPFRTLLLDEPSSGLDTQESRRFGDLLQLVCARGVGILLVEHDIALVSRVCEHLYVLDFGKPLLDGPTHSVLRSEQVIAAYLGSSAAVGTPAPQEAVSGV